MTSVNEVHCMAKPDVHFLSGKSSLREMKSRRKILAPTIAEKMKNSSVFLRALSTTFTLKARFPPALNIIQTAI